MNFTSTSYHEFMTHGTSLHAHIYTGQSIIDLLMRTNNEVPPLPQWITTGAILGLQEGTSQVRAKVFLIF